MYAYLIEFITEKLGKQKKVSWFFFISSEENFSRILK